MNKLFYFPLLIGSMAIVACAPNSASSKQDLAASDLDFANLDTTVAAQTDFYDYATGGWQKLHPLKAEYSRFGSFDLLAENNREQIRSLVEEIAAKQNPAGSVAEKIAFVYNAGMDSVRLNQEGAEPLKPYLERIAALADKKDALSKFIGESNRMGQHILFSVGVEPDLKNSAMNMVSLGQGGLGLGEKVYYLSEEADFVKIRAEYLKFISKLFTLMGDDQQVADQKAATVLAFETELAKGSYSNVELRDLELSYNKMAMADFKAKSKLFNWELLLSENGLGTAKDINAAHVRYFDNLEKVLDKTSLDDLKVYLTYDLVSSYSSSLSDAFNDAVFDFYGRVMSGRQEQQPRWKRALNRTNSVLGEAVGEMYVQKYFPAEAKERMLKLVSNLQGAFADRIKALDWMSDTTKNLALEKLASFTVKIGYPDKWKDYSSLVINKDDSYMSSLIKAGQFAWAEMLEKDFEKPVDKAEWHMTPQTVNAYYNPTANEIVFPAAILQPPFFYLKGDDAINYGAIGVVIGHEMTHGFDDMGSHFDKEGNMIEWWSADDRAKFDAKTQVLVNQFDSVKIFDDLNANGRLSLGENIADQGGLLIAYQALQKALDQAGNQAAPAGDFSNDQRFYLSYATVWAQNIRDEEARQLTNMDEHSLARNRVNVSLRNIEKFYEAFGIKEADKMYLAPENRINIW